MPLLLRLVPPAAPAAAAAVCHCCCLPPLLLLLLVVTVASLSCGILAPFTLRLIYWYGCGPARCPGCNGRPREPGETPEDVIPDACDGDTSATWTSVEVRFMFEILAAPPLYAKEFKAFMFDVPEEVKKINDETGESMKCGRQCSKGLAGTYAS